MTAQPVLADRQVLLVGSWGPDTDEALVQALETAVGRVQQVRPEDGLAAADVVVLVSPPPESTSGSLDHEATFVQPLEAAWMAARSAIAALRAAGGGALTFALPAGDDVVRSTLAGGLSLLTRALAVECGEDAAGIRVNAATIDPQRVDDGARLVAFLCGAAASFVSGQVIALSP